MCEACGQDGNKKKKISPSDHAMIAHISYKETPCCENGSSIGNEKELISHLQQKHVKKYLICRTCSTRCNDTPQMLKHIERHFRANKRKNASNEKQN